MLRDFCLSREVCSFWHGSVKGRGAENLFLLEAAGGDGRQVHSDNISHLLWLAIFDPFGPASRSQLITAQSQPIIRYHYADDETQQFAHLCGERRYNFAIYLCTM